MKMKEWKKQEQKCQHKKNKKTCLNTASVFIKSDRSHCIDLSVLHYYLMAGCSRVFYFSLLG